ncbi:exonuclease domain-containing protein [Corynebacterium lowii]|uniref:DNA polymerase III PolC-type n=1 Tax=Corynebacterium lowii TaxID=1544413 RepID=A0A0N8W0H5_9CORY|nr:exonuclease domain-containing protein [Corynebacterium lowii]KQB86714.1 DNA polymerase III PolC-type [Corynebacterium lowii]MDP9851400.1 DNA polymerase-3 subunit epsilon [Corynebacterium lowii]
MIPAHGAQVSISADEVLITYSELAAALAGKPQYTVPLAQVAGVESHLPTAYQGGWVDLLPSDSEAEHAPVRLRFAPNQEAQARQCAQAIDAALRGEDPALPGAQVSGLDFVALDVETANADWGSVCQIGVVRFIDGIAQDTASWLCQPPVPGFDPANVRIHGIAESDVAQSPTFAEVLPEVTAFIGDLPFVAHNAQFDATALHRACAAAGISAPALSFGCSLALSRVQRLDVRNHRLPTVAAALDVELDHHHDALADAHACGSIVAALAARQDWEGSTIGFIHSQGFTLGTLGADKVFPVLKDRTGAGIAAQQRELGGSQQAILLDTVPESAPEKKAPAKKKNSWRAVSTPEVIPEPNPEASPDGLLFGHHVTLSGDFEPFDKGTLWQRIADQGAQIGKNVTKKTTVLVTGAWTTKTSKHKRAEELQEQGQPIEIWSQEELLAALGLNEEPPF